MSYLNTTKFVLENLFPKDIANLPDSELIRDEFLGCFVPGTKTSDSHDVEVLASKIAKKIIDYMPNVEYMVQLPDVIIDNSLFPNYTNPNLGNYLGDLIDEIKQRGLDLKLYKALIADGVKLNFTLSNVNAPPGVEKFEESPIDIDEIYGAMEKSEERAEKRRISKE